jgi:hypothetical protein
LTHKQIEERDSPTPLKKNKNAGGKTEGFADSLKKNKNDRGKAAKKINTSSKKKQNYSHFCPLRGTRGL